MLTVPLTLMLLAAIAFVVHGMFARAAALPEPVFFGGDGFGCGADALA
jgi:hypothetical protein